MSVPDTLLISGEDPVWLTTNAQGVVCTRRLKKKWRDDFVKVCLDATPFPDEGDPIVAVLKVSVSASVSVSCAVCRVR